MAEVTKSGAFAKVFQKTLARTRTKVLQRVGKAEKTTDEVFKDNIAAFQRQQAAAIRLQKEMKHYLGCVRAMSAAAKGLYAVLKETYEEDWYDPHTFNSSLTSLELLHTNYEAELSERIYSEMNKYADQFPVYKEKMNKRNRKLLDFDNAKHAHEALTTAKKVDHTKVAKAQESLAECKSLYEEINNELHKELPKFYDYRIEFLAENLMRLCNAESTFHVNAGKINDQLWDLLQTLATTHAEEVERQKTLSLNKTADSSYGAGEGLDLSSLSPDVHTPGRPNGNSGDIATSTPNHRKTNNGSQKVSKESESRRPPPPARPDTVPRSPVSTLQSPSDGSNPFVTSDDGEAKQITHTDKAADDNAVKDAPSQLAADPPGNPFEEEDSDAAEDTPVETVADIVVEKTPDDAMDIGAETAVNTAAETAVDTAADAAVDTAADTVAETAVDTAAETVVDTAADTAVDTAADTAVDTAAETAVDTAAKTAVDTAAETAVDTAAKTAVDTNSGVNDSTSAAVSEAVPGHAVVAVDAPTTLDKVEPEVVANEKSTVTVSGSSTRSDGKHTSSVSSSVVLYQVMATHPYEAEDDDELSFEAGEIINVVEFDGEDEQDDGWLMGVHPTTSAKGVFPANFTQKIARKT